MITKSIKSSGWRRKSCGDKGHPVARPVNLRNESYWRGDGEVRGTNETARDAFLTTMILGAFSRSVASICDLHCATGWRKRWIRNRGKVFLSLSLFLPSSLSSWQTSLNPEFRTAEPCPIFSTSVSLISRFTFVLLFFVILARSLHRSKDRSRYYCRKNCRPRPLQKYKGRNRAKGNEYTVECALISLLT